MKVAICTPCHSRPHHRYVKSLAALLVRHSEHELRLFLERRSPVSLNRNLIAEKALAWGADALLWFDDDQIFPEDTLERLLAPDKAVIGCNIAIRMDKPLPMAARWNGREWERVYTTKAKADKGEVEPVGKLGFGVVLTRREVFEAVEPPWFIEALRRDRTFVGEDYHFFEQARAKGFQPYVDHALSWEVGHVHERVLFPADTLPH